MVDPVTAGLISWACGKLGDNVLGTIDTER